MSTSSAAPGESRDQRPSGRLPPGIKPPLKTFERNQANHLGKQPPPITPHSSSQTDQARRPPQPEHHAQQAKQQLREELWLEYLDKEQVSVLFSGMSQAQVEVELDECLRYREPKRHEVRDVQ
ncbi:hypothetical protein NW755_014374, partial [Fusarium falciforme]